MSITVTLTEMLILLGGVLSTIGAVGAMLIRQVDRRLDERFRAIEEARAEHHKAWSDLFTNHIAREEHEFEALRNLEREMMHFRADLPTLYLRRDEMRDYLIRLDMRFESLHDKINRIMPTPEEKTA